MLHTAALWDLAGIVAVLPAWWPAFSYVAVALGVAAACIAAAARVLLSRRSRGHAAATAVQLLAAGVLLGAWMLRGDAEIPPDPPIVWAQVGGALTYVIGAVLRRRVRGSAA